MSDSLPLRCNCRKKEVTSLRCSRCFAPICPNCSKNAPVGMICRQCASSGRSPAYQVDGASLAKAAPVCLIVAIFGGWLLATLGGLGFFAAFVAFLYGFGVGEVGYRLTGRKRGRSIEIMVGTCILIGILAGFAIHFSIPEFAHAPYAIPFDRDGDPLPVTQELIRLTLLNPWSYATIAISVFGGVCRIRRE